jgi:hypothetical protein
MAYSRWSTESPWFTYWAIPANEDERDNKWLQCFDICSLTSFTYREIKEDIDYCVEQASLKNNGASKKEKKLLKKCMLLFVKDVEKAFNEPTKYEKTIIAINNNFFKIKAILKCKARIAKYSIKKIKGKVL